MPIQRPRPWIDNTGPLVHANVKRYDGWLTTLRHDNRECGKFTYPSMPVPANQICTCDTKAWALNGSYQVYENELVMVLVH